MFPWSKKTKNRDPLRQLRPQLLVDFVLDPDSIHGPAHWKRVEGYGLYLAPQTGADPLVVRLFALFHDSQRQDDGWDPDHGPRAADKARAMRSLIPLADEAFETLCEACFGHTKFTFSADPTVATCWDADRLDLDRVGQTVDPERINTEEGKRLARLGPLQRRQEAGLLTSRK